VRRLCLLLAAACLLIAVPARAAEREITVASKAFSESYVLAEIVAQLLEAEGFPVDRKLGLGGTLIAFDALREGAVDVYPEYTGTLTQAILNEPGMSLAELEAALVERGLVFRVPLGFDNSYAIAVTEEMADARGLLRVGDLAGQADLGFGFSHEFLNRADGWPALKAAYGLTQQASGIEHALAYRALESGHLDVTDAYTTDGELDLYALRLLADDRGFFPTYDAGLLTRDDMPAPVADVLMRLESRIDEATMRGLNRRVASQGEEPARVAADFLRETGLVSAAAGVAAAGYERILGNTLVHLKLTGIALLLGCLVAVPLALLVARHHRIASGLLYVTGLVQTVPSLALLALLIPLVGLGQVPAIIALFLYSLLPIVRNTLTGLFNVDPLLKEVAGSMGLTPVQQLRKVELPLAMPTILAGIKTAAIISIGTATLAAFVGAGGLGEPIITGLTLNDHALILEGAVPAALLAVAAELLFELIERATVPAHLRVS
jgi:osmoprotectant transport system permease protein